MTRGSQIVSCSMCGKETRKSNSSLRAHKNHFCSKQCSSNWNSVHPVKPKTGRFQKCIVCGKSMWVIPVYFETRRYCSYKCKYIGGMKQEIRKCEVCGKDISKPASTWKWHALRKHKKIFCSVKCQALGYRGRNNPQFKEIKKDRRRPDANFREWRIKVYSRDDYTCAWCGKRGTNLNPHHIVKWKDSEHLRFVVENGITLCEKCHSFTKNSEYLFADIFLSCVERFYGKNANTEQIRLALAETIKSFKEGEE